MRGRPLLRTLWAVSDLGSLQGNLVPAGGGGAVGRLQAVTASEQPGQLKELQLCSIIAMRVTLARPTPEGSLREGQCPGQTLFQILAGPGPSPIGRNPTLQT